jgi:mono/diheme cytochrome c family protein
MRTLRITAVAFFGSLALIGWCVGAGRAENPDQESVYAELAKAPEKYRTKANPLASDKDAVAAGKILFEEHCEDCHGSGATGGRKAPSLRAKEVQDATPGTLFWILTNGVVRKKMPVWSKLPEPERWQLVSYLKSLGPVETAESKGAEHKK